MDDITPLGWIAIFFCGILLIATNLSLITLLKQKKKQGKSVGSSNKVLETIKNPWGEEDRQWQELSRQVESYKTKTGQSKDDTNLKQND